MKDLTTYYFAQHNEDGYMGVLGDDAEPLRAPTREELMKRLDEAKNYMEDCRQQGLVVESKLFIVKETITVEEITE
jgi:hypothetical protein